MTSPQSPAPSPDDREAIITVRGLVNRFGEQVVHDGLDLDVRRGEILGVVGGSGTGKSVLMRSLIGLIGCLEGLQVTGTAQSVGERTTSSVVQTISLVIVFDAFAAIWFMQVGW